MESPVISPEVMKVIHERSDMDILKLLVNPFEREVEDNPKWRCPLIGSKVEIISYDGQMNVQECVRVAKLPFLTVKRVHPVIVGIGRGKSAWVYEIEVNESNLIFMQWHYIVIS